MTCVSQAANISFSLWSLMDSSLADQASDAKVKEQILDVDRVKPRCNSPKTSRVWKEFKLTFSCATLGRLYVQIWQKGLFVWIGTDGNIWWWILANALGLWGGLGLFVSVLMCCLSNVLCNLFLSFFSVTLSGGVYDLPSETETCGWRGTLVSFS